MPTLVIRVPVGTPKFSLAAIQLREDALKAFREIEVDMHQKGCRQWEGLILNDWDLAYDQWTATTPGMVLWLRLHAPEHAETVKDV